MGLYHFESHPKQATNVTVARAAYTHVEAPGASAHPQLDLSEPGNNKLRCTLPEPHAGHLSSPGGATPPTWRRGMSRGCPQSWRPVQPADPSLLPLCRRKTRAFMGGHLPGVGAMFSPLLAR